MFSILNKGINSVFIFLFNIRDSADKRIHLFAYKNLQSMRRVYLSRLCDLFFSRIYNFIPPLELVMSFVIAGFITIFGVVGLLETIAEHNPSFKSLYNQENSTYNYINYSIVFGLTIVFRSLMYVSLGGQTANKKSKIFISHFFHFFKPLELALSFIFSVAIVFFSVTDFIELIAEYVPPFKAIYFLENGTTYQIVFSVVLGLTIILRLLIYAFIDIPIAYEGKERRNKKAKEIWQNLQKGKPQEFTLYLRRFFCDTGMDIELYQESLLGFPKLWRRPLDYPFWKSAPIKKPLIQIGLANIYETSSAGCLEFPSHEKNKAPEKQEWFFAFQKLASASDKIIAFPLTTNSEDPLYKEIKWIKDNDILHKTVFIMPPKCKVYYSEEGNKKYNKQINIKERWNESCAALKEFLNLNLPKYSSKGGYITFPKKNTVLFFQNIAGRAWRSKSIIKAVLKGKTIPSRLRFSFVFAIDQTKYLLTIWIAYIYIFLLNQKDVEKFQLDTGVYVFSNNFILFVTLPLLLVPIFRAFGKLKGLMASILFIPTFAFLLKAPSIFNQVFILDLGFMFTIIFAVSMLIAYICFDEKKYYVPQAE